MKQCKIYFTSDTHGFLFPTNYADREEKDMGLLKLIEQFEVDGNTIICDGGDSIVGSPFTFHHRDLQCKVHPVATVLNAGGYQFVTLGNHDFNYGLEYLDGYLSSLDATCVCANIRDKAGKLPIKDWAIMTLENGLRVGVTGICTDFVKIWEKKETLEQLEIEEPVQAAGRALEEMKGLVDLTICIYHGGIEKELDTGRLLTTLKENQACRIAEKLEFDLLLTGHQHKSFAGQEYHGTWIVQPTDKAKEFVECLVSCDEGSRKKISSRLVCPTGKIHEEAAEELQELEDEVQKWLDTPKGNLSIALQPKDHLDAALHGLPLANFFNMVQLHATGADISGTSLANEYKGFDTKVSVRDVVATYVYANTLVVLSVSGEVIKKYLERSAAYFTYQEETGEIGISDEFLLPKEAHYNYDWLMGIDYTFDLSKPVGERVVSMTRNGKEIQMTDHWKLVINNYRASGTGGYEFLTECPVLQEDLTEMTDILIDYIEKNEIIEVDTKAHVHVIQDKES